MHNVVAELSRCSTLNWKIIANTVNSLLRARMYFQVDCASKTLENPGTVLSQDVAME